MPKGHPWRSPRASIQDARLSVAGSARKARDRGARDRSELELLQELAVLPRAPERIFQAFLLHVAELVVDVRNGSQQALEVHRTRAQHGVVRAVRDYVFKMKAPIPVAVALQIGERIAAPDHHIADVELE